MLCYWSTFPELFASIRIICRLTSICISCLFCFFFFQFLWYSSHLVRLVELRRFPSLFFNGLSYPYFFFFFAYILVNLYSFQMLSETGVWKMYYNERKSKRLICLIWKEMACSVYYKTQCTYERWKQFVYTLLWEEWLCIVVVYVIILILDEINKNIFTW